MQESFQELAQEGLPIDQIVPLMKNRGISWEPAEEVDSIGGADFEATLLEMKQDCNALFQACPSSV